MILPEKMVSLASGLSGQVFFMGISMVSSLKWSHYTGRSPVISSVSHSDISLLSLPFVDALTHYYFQKYVKSQYPEYENHEMITQPGSYCL